MHVKATIIAIAFAGYAFYPAAGAPAEQINCPIEGLTDAEFNALVEHTVALGSQDAPIHQRFVESVSNCALELGWSNDEIEMAAQFTLGLFGTVGARQQLTDQGIDVEQIEFAILSDEIFLRAVRSGAVSDADIDAMVERQSPMLESLLSGREKEQGLVEMVGQYMMMRTLQEIARERFMSG